MFKSSFLLLLTAVAVMSCTSVQKEISARRYSSALTLGVSKIKGKSKKSPKAAIGLKEAYPYYIDEQFEKIDKLKLQGQNEVKILGIYEDIHRMNARIRPLLPIRDKDGGITDFPLTEVQEEVNFYKNQAADALYASALNYLDKGTKADAREAHRLLSQMQGISGSTAHLKNLQAQAKESGTTFILGLTEIDPKISLGRIPKETFTSWSEAELSKTWQVVHFSPEKNRKYDYELYFILQDFVVSPEKESSRTYTDKKEIEESVGSSSRDNEKIKRKKEVSAEVIEVYQFKEAQVRGQVVIYDKKTRKDIYKEEVTAGQKFENYASTFKGDKRALSDISLKRIGGKPLNFPSNDRVLSDALVALKSAMASKATKAYTTF
jgi:hypothetical protein